MRDTTLDQHDVCPFVWSGILDAVQNAIQYFIKLQSAIERGSRIPQSFSQGTLLKLGNLGFFPGGDVTHNALKAHDVVALGHQRRRLLDPFLVTILGEDGKFEQCFVRLVLKLAPVERPELLPGSGFSLIPASSREPHLRGEADEAQDQPGSEERQRPG